MSATGEIDIDYCNKPETQGHARERKQNQHDLTPEQQLETADNPESQPARAEKSKGKPPRQLATRQQDQPAAREKHQPAPKPEQLATRQQHHQQPASRQLDRSAWKQQPASPRINKPPPEPPQLKSTRTRANIRPPARYQDYQK